MKHYGVNEIFDSVQGEGVLVGSPATFIRLQGCTVGCPWCDSGPVADDLFGRHTNGLTRNTWGKGGTRMTADEIINQTHRYHVIITGGEPTIYDLDPLIAVFHKQNRFVQIETSGQNELKGDLKPDWITWSPKPNLDWDAPESIRFAAKEVKWVMDGTVPYCKIFNMWHWMFSHRENLPYFVFMPEGCPPTKERSDEVLKFLDERGIGVVESKYWRFGDRLQYRLKVR